MRLIIVTNMVRSYCVFMRRCLQPAVAVNYLEETAMTLAKLLFI